MIGSDIQNPVAILDVCIKRKPNKIIELHNQWNFQSDCREYFNEINADRVFQAIKFYSSWIITKMADWIHF